MRILNQHITKIKIYFIIGLNISALLIFSSCNKNKVFDFEWLRSENNPVFRDQVLDVDYNYEIASDAHVFYDDYGNLKMIYTGDVNEKVAIKIASGESWENWTTDGTLLSETNSAGLDVYKETAFYRKSDNGKHQIYYIGYEDEETYQAQIFLAESDSLYGPYFSLPEPVIANGTIAEKNVYCMTSPSVIDHNDTLFISFIGWNDKPEKVSEVWIIGAYSIDQGHTWSNFRLVDTKIGMEGQITKTPNGTFVAVRTAKYKRKEAIYYSTADHPFGPWTENTNPILIQKGSPFEKDEIIAPQITFDKETNKEYLFYTGADHKKGWWIMLATKEYE